MSAPGSRSTTTVALPHRSASARATVVLPNPPGASRRTTAASTSPATIASRSVRTAAPTSDEPTSAACDAPVRRRGRHQQRTLPDQRASHSTSPRSRCHSGRQSLPPRLPLDPAALCGSSVPRSTSRRRLGASHQRVEVTRRQNPRRSGARLDRQAGELHSGRCCNVSCMPKNHVDPVIALASGRHPGALVEVLRRDKLGDGERQVQHGSVHRVPPYGGQDGHDARRQSRLQPSALPDGGDMVRRHGRDRAYSGHPAPAVGRRR